MKRAEITKSLNHAHLRGRVTVNVWVPVETALDWCEQGTLVTVEKETLTTIKSAVGDVRSGCGGDDDGIGINGESKEGKKSLWSPIAIRGDPYHVYEAYQRIYSMAEGELDDIVMAFPVHPRRIDKLVGMHGERLKKVSADTGVRVYAPTHVPAAKGGYDKVLPLEVGVFPKSHVQLEGVAENVFTALALFVKAAFGVKVIIHDVCGGAEDNSGSSNSTKQVPQKQMGWADQITTVSASSTLTTPMPEVQTERILKLAGGNLGILVGSNGKTTSVLRGIMKFTTVTLSTKVSSRIAPAAKDGEVKTEMDVELQLKGSENCVELASDAILSLLKGEPIKDVMARTKRTGNKQGYSHPQGGGSGGRGSNARNLGSGGGKGRGRGGGRGGGSSSRTIKGGKENTIGQG